MAGKAYVLTTGFADERRVLAVYSTQEAATAALRFGDDDTKVEEFALDAPLPAAPDGCSLWHVVEDSGTWVNRLDAFTMVDPIDVVYAQGNGHVVSVWARDDHHALLLGSGKITAFKAGTAALGAR